MQIKYVTVYLMPYGYACGICNSKPDPNGEMVLLYSAFYASNDEVFSVFAHTSCFDSRYEVVCEGDE
jgi:hypothetical protein